MNNIKNEKDVLEWAELIVNSKGDKYVPLSKADMYAIAQFVVTYAPSAPLEDVPPPPSAPKEEDDEPPKATATAVEKDKPYVEERQPTGEGMSVSSTATREPTQKVTMTRGYALHHAQFTTQQAYDKFLEWSKEHPKEGSVMDFSTGVKSTNAAFAYWLMENIVVEVPATTTYAR